MSRGLGDVYKRQSVYCQNSVSKDKEKSGERSYYLRVVAKDCL